MNWVVFLIASLYVCLGYVLGTYLGHRRNSAAEEENLAESEETAGEEETSKIDAEQARKFLEHLRELAGNVDHDVNRHASRVAKISGALSENPTKDPATVLEAATQLIEANKQLQTDLVVAKKQIQIQQQQLDSYMTEARTDALTGLANRRAFDQEFKRRFSQWDRQGIPLSLVLVDVDHFKNFNDKHGHQAGDQVLQEVSEVLTRTVRQMDIVARYGGEELAVILPGTTLREARPAVERLRTAVSDHRFNIENNLLQITVSVGLAQAIEEDTIEQLVKRADASLYAAKEAGRNCSFLHNGEECERIEVSFRNDFPVAVNRAKRIAPFIDGRFPEQSMFREVECEVITPTGFSYLLPEKPDYERVLMAWGSSSGSSYMTATIKSSTNLGSKKDPMYRISCEFTTRAEFAQESSKNENAEPCTSGVGGGSNSP